VRRPCLLRCTSHALMPVLLVCWVQLYDVMVERCGPSMNSGPK
jgi:hypothetical protein